jgi:hypothetical protein
MEMRRTLFAAVAAALLVAFTATAGHALSISPDWTSDGSGVWTESMEDVVRDAMWEWTSRLCPPITIFIDFQLGNLGTGGTLGMTSDMVENPSGLPVSATITMNTNAGLPMSWDLGGAYANTYDALTILKHEIGHAIGISMYYSLFGEHMYYFDRNHNGHYDNGEDMYFDSDEDGQKDAGDYDLYDSFSTHLADSSDLMYPFLGMGERKHPSEADFDLLHIAYGYPVHEPVPEPCTMLLVVGGLAGLAALKRRRG